MRLLDEDEEAEDWRPLAEEPVNMLTKSWRIERESWRLHFRGR